MINYFEKIEYNLDKIWFQAFNRMYNGRGLLTWDPETGFHIDAFVERKGPELLSPIPLGKVGYISKKDKSSIQMKSKSFNHAIIPCAIVYGHNELIWDRRLSLDSDKIIIFNRYKTNTTKKFVGTVLFKTKSDLILPYNVKTTEKVGVEKEFFGLKNMIYYKNKDHIIKGEYTRKKYLSIYFELSTYKWSRAQCWKWAEAVRYALSIISGENISLLHRKITRGTQNIEEIREENIIDILGIFSPLEEGPINQDILIKLTEFFLSEKEKNKTNIRICKNIYNQLIEASRQKTHQGQELLISTILEASLRTIDNHPFKEGDRSWNLRKSMKKFKENYFSDDWKEFCEMAIRFHINLRNRNAHPDWLIRKGGSISEEALSKAFDDMIFLSRFYGYMILALAGFKNLKPQFPLPHKEWKPMATISIIEENDSQNCKK